MALSLTDKIVGLYRKGISLSDITMRIKKIYYKIISAATLCSITDKVILYI